MFGHLGYNLIFISKEDEAKTMFGCSGAVGQTDKRYSYLPTSNEPHLPLVYCQHCRGGVYWRCSCEVFHSGYLFAKEDFRDDVL